MKLNETMSGKNINFLIGSGASVPFYRTLSLGDDKPSFEELLSTDQISDCNKKILYYYYYHNVILPMESLIDDNQQFSQSQTEVLKNYKLFIKKLLSFLKDESNEKPKRINVFTTNYDLMFEKCFQEILNEKTNCFFNDGSVGFINRTLNPQNFNLNICRTGYLDKYKKEVPTINLIKIHGSISWEKHDKDTIKVNYLPKIIISEIKDLNDNEFSNLLSLMDKTNNSNLNARLSELYATNKNEIDDFYEKYKSLAIINPNKWKFYETVFEQHYYQQLRNFSYELEKENSILIIFGFSFADEHIKEVFERVLNNPSLEVYLICYNQKVQDDFKNIFNGGNNIEFLPNFKNNKDGTTILGNFSYLNSLFGGIDG